MSLKATYSEFDLGHILKAFSLQIFQCSHLIIQCRVKMKGGVMHDPSSIQNQFVKETVCRIQFAILLCQRFMGLLPIVKVCDVKEVFLHQFLFSV